MKLDLKTILPSTIDLAKNAGQAILSLYNQEQPILVELKADASPVTQADRDAHQIIKVGLEQITKGIPILSEEADEISFSIREQWEKYWLIDPLDGTKEFIHRTDDFTVNIALIENHVPILGVVYAPVFDLCYYASYTHGAYKQEGTNETQRIHVRKCELDHITVAMSRRHGSDAVKNFLTDLKPEEVLPRGSSIKSCLVAEGKADIYPCLGKTSEWDMAAAQMVVTEAGGIMIDLEGMPLKFNMKSSLLNPPLLILGDSTFDWKKYF
ncbi:MAG: 3'(2'),5'-bisphosphate nucleotidase CysQ [Gammaproteobacteria bacterium]